MLPKNIKFLIDITLGDGWIGYKDSGRKNAYYICCHGEKQIDYCKYKENILESFGYIINGVDKINSNQKSKNYGKRYYTIYSREHVDFSTVHKHVYNKNKKTIDRHLLRDLDAESLAYWFMDDGCAKTVKYNQTKTTRIYYEIPKVGSYSIATNCFSYSEHLLIVDWLSEKFDIQATISKHTKHGYNISINTIENKNKFRDLLLPYVEKVPCLMYKFSYPHSHINVAHTTISREINNLSREETERNDSFENKEDATVQA